jgi:hypothetical protein
MKLVFPLYLRISFLLLAITNILPSWFSISVPRAIHWAIGIQFIGCLFIYLVSLSRQKTTLPN